MKKNKNKTDTAFAHSFWNYWNKRSYNMKKGDSKVYCQVSGEEMTEIGCYIGDDKRSYCSGYEANNSPAKRSKTFVSVKYYSPVEVQKAIKEGILVYFYKLNDEEIVNYNKLEKISEDLTDSESEELVN